MLSYAFIYFLMLSWISYDFKQTPFYNPHHSINVCSKALGRSLVNFSWVLRHFLSSWIISFKTMSGALWRKQHTNNLQNLKHLSKPINIFFGGADCGLSVLSCIFLWFPSGPSSKLPGYSEDKWATQQNGNNRNSEIRNPYSKREIEKSDWKNLWNKDFHFP